MFPAVVASAAALAAASAAARAAGSPASPPARGLSADQSAAEGIGHGAQAITRVRKLLARPDDGVSTLVQVQTDGGDGARVGDERHARGPRGRALVQDENRRLAVPVQKRDVAHGVQTQAFGEIHDVGFAHGRGGASRANLALRARRAGRVGVVVVLLVLLVLLVAEGFALHRGEKGEARFSLGG